MTEPPRSPITIDKLVDNLKSSPHHRHEHHLCNPFAGLYGEGLMAPIPAGHIKLALVIRINQSDQIAQHDTVLVAQTGAWQQYRRQTRVGDMDGYAGGQQFGLSGLQMQRFVETGKVPLSVTEC